MDIRLQKFPYIWLAPIELKLELNLDEGKSASRSFRIIESRTQTQLKPEHRQNHMLNCMLSIVFERVSDWDK